MSFIVGLTGGIGSGKTTVANFFAELGAAVVDTDVIAHQLTAPRGAAMPAIIAAFGRSVLRGDGSLDRQAMRQRCFSDPATRQRLEAILHPMIRSESLKRSQNAGDAPYVLLVVPLLIESGAYRERVDRILVVDCEESAQIARVIERSGLSADEVRTIMSTQATRAARLAVANDVVANNGSRDELQRQILALHRRYIELAHPTDAGGQQS